MKALTLNRVTVALVSIIVPVILFAPGWASAQSLNKVCTHAPFLAGCGAGSAGLAPASGGGYIASLVNSFIFIAAIVSVFFIMIAGIKYITAGGDPARTVSAKNTLQYAIVGLIVAIIARAIVGFVVGRV